MNRAMSKVKEARLKAKLSKNGLAGLAGVASDTIDRAERGQPIQEVKAYAIVEALNARLPENLHVSLSDMEIYGA